MKYGVLSAILFFSFRCFAQETVSNQLPHAGTDFKQYLYLGFDNPVYISTGKLKSLNVTTDNGTIKSTGKTGSYLINPSKSGVAVITLSSDHYKAEFRFEVRPMAYPAIRLTGQPTEDGVIDIKRSATGIAAVQLPFDVDIDWKIDSFIVLVKDSLRTDIHMNSGATWDNVTKQMIGDAKSDSRILIYKVYMTGPRRQKIESNGYLECYVW